MGAPGALKLLNVMLLPLSPEIVIEPVSELAEKPLPRLVTLALWNVLPF